MFSLTAVCPQRSRDDFRWGAWRATKTHMPKLHLALFTAINLLNYLDRYLVAAVLPLIMSDMALTNEEGGRLVAAFVFGYFLFSPVFGYLGDRYDRPKLMALGVVVWSLATIGTGLATGFAVFFAVRILVGIGEASFSTIAPGFLKDRIGDPIKLNSALAIFFAAIPVGAALGYVVGGEVAHHLNWQAAFFVGGIPGILLAVFLLRFRDQRAAPSGEARAAVGVRAVFARPILRYAIGGYVLNTFALTGLPLTAGFFSKDAIIEAAFASQRPGAVYAFILTAIAAGLTSFYSWRLVFLTFFGEPRWTGHGAGHGAAHGDAHAHAAHGHDDHAHGAHGHGHGHHVEPHESPAVMLIPLFVLAFGAIFAGLAFKDVFIGDAGSAFWKDSLFYGPQNTILKDFHYVPAAVPFVATVMMLIGFLASGWMYIVRPGSADQLAKRHSLLYRFFLNKWYFDELYNLIFVRPSFWLGRLFWKGGDQKVIDGFGPDGVAAAARFGGRQLRRAQSGFVFHYSFLMLAAAVAFGAFAIWAGGGLEFAGVTR